MGHSQPKHGQDAEDVGWLVALLLTALLGPVGSRPS